MELNKVCEQAIEVIKATAAFIATERKKFTEDMVKEKSLNSLVSHVDIEAEKMLVKGLKNILPASGFLTEEKTVAGGETEYTWIIDPLDGTTNFIHNLPVYSISVALQHKSKLVLGVVYEINRDECFSAYEGSPAVMNGKPIRVTNATSLSHCLIATGFPYEKFNYLDKFIDTLRYFMMNTRGVRRLGSAAVDLAYVACGRFDAYYEYNLNPWDVAAGAFIVQQAGGVTTDFSGTDNFIAAREILAGNNAIAEQMLAELKK